MDKQKVKMNMAYIRVASRMQPKAAKAANRNAKKPKSK